MITSICSIPCDSSNMAPARLSATPILAVVKRCFEHLASWLLFPCRYLGSKTWSIPGALLRIPSILFQRLFNRPLESYSEQIFCSSGYERNFSKELTPDELQAYLPNFAAAAYVSNSNPQYIPSGWKCMNVNQLDLKIDGLEARDGYFFDPVTGFKACILEKEENAILVFSSLKGSTSPEKPKFGSGANASIALSILGANPRVCELADLLTKQIKSHPSFAKKQLVLTGACYGAHQATYAALKHSVQAVCINPFPLGAGQQYELGNQKLARAKDLVTNISVKGDFLSHNKLLDIADIALNAIGIKTPGVFGKRYRIPTPYKGAHEIHTYFVGSAMAHLGHDCRTMPASLM